MCWKGQLYRCLRKNNGAHILCLLQTNFSFLFVSPTLKTRTDLQTNKPDHKNIRPLIKRTSCFFLSILDFFLYFGFSLIYIVDIISIMSSLTNTINSYDVMSLRGASISSGSNVHQGRLDLNHHLV